MKSIMVTGGAGFVGSSLAMGLKAAYGHTRVVALDNLRRRGSELNVPRLREGGVEFVHGDVRNTEDFDALPSVDLILECSAEPSVLAGYNEAPGYLVQTNLVGTLNCLEFARRTGAAIIFLSSSRVYPMTLVNELGFKETETRFALLDEQKIVGASAAGIAENFPLDGTRSLYGATKLSSELILNEYLEMYGLQGIVNRCGIIAGPWQMGKLDQGVAVLWASRHIYEQPLNYIGYGGQGKQVRDMVHIDDMLRLVLHQIEHLDDLSGETFNVGGGTCVSTSLMELTRLCAELTGNTLDIGSVPENRPADLRIYITDHSKLTERTGWHPDKGVRSIMEDIVAWIVDNRESLRPILG